MLPETGRFDCRPPKKTAAQISVADYLGGIDWSLHEQASSWYSVFKSRPSFRPLLTERMDVIQPPAHYADVNA